MTWLLASASEDISSRNEALTKTAFSFSSSPATCQIRSVGPVSPMKMTGALLSKSYHVADTFNRVIDPDGSNRKTAEIQLHFRLDRPEADRGFFFIRNYGEVRPDGVVEKVLFQGVQDAFRADDGDRKIPAGTDIDVVRQEHDIAYMVQVGMGDEDMIDPGLFLHGKGG